MSRIRSPSSLRRRLLRELLPSLVLLWLAGSAFILMRSWEELEEAYVDQLDQLAFTLAQVLDSSALTPEAAVESLRARRDRNFFVIVLREGQPVLRSAGAPDGVVELPAAGNETAGYYLARAEAREGAVTVIAGLEKAEVRQLTASVVGGAAVPLALGLLAMAGILFLAIHRGLRPLERLRADLEERRPDAMDPVDGRGLPAELAPVVEAVNNLLDRLRRAVMQERRFVADASHELRTPLAAIRAQVETIDRSRLDSETQATLDQILRGVERSSRLAQQLLRLARADAVGRPGVPVLQLEAQVTGIVSDLFPLAVRHDAELELDCTPAQVRARPEDLEMLIGNLLENAIHHGGAGGLIRVSCGGGAKGAWLQVEDAGPGIPEAERPRLFERFRRGASTHADGSGLGLSIVASVAARLSAEVRLSRSEILGGLCAEVRFAAQDLGVSPV